MYRICQEVVDLIWSNKLREASAKYSGLEKVTIETAITNKTDKLAMSVSNKIGWSDLGKWHVIKKILKPKHGDNLTKGRVIANETENSLIYSTVNKKIIAVNDVKDLVIVDTEDALFVSSLEKSAEVKKIVEQLKEEGQDKYL